MAQDNWHGVKKMGAANLARPHIPVLSVVHLFASSHRVKCPRVQNLNTHLLIIFGSSLRSKLQPSY